MNACVNLPWEEYSEPLKRFIQKRVANEQDAEDILQEVFVMVYQNIDSLMDEHKIHGWIYKITRNKIIDYYRSKDKKLDVVKLADEFESTIDDDDSSNAEIASCLKSMIDSLPEEYKQAILLTEFQDMTQKELSQKMGISLSGAKSRVQRARRRLRGMLLGCCYIEFDRRGNVIDYKLKNCSCKYC